MSQYCKLGQSHTYLYQHVVRKDICMYAKYIVYAVLKTFTVSMSILLMDVSLDTRTFGSGCMTIT
jgi:hypothetical protein